VGFYISKFISEWILPPGGLILLLVAGIWLNRRKNAWGTRLIYFATFALFILTLPIASMSLMSIIEPYPAIAPDRLTGQSAQAIVILGGGRSYDAAEYQGDTVSEVTLERLRYGVFIQHKTGLPILVTGGSPLEDRQPEGWLMSETLKQSFQISPQWVEDESVNTAENAIFSNKILKKQGIRRILLVTNAWHMPRAVTIFEAQGLEVVAAPTAFEGFSKKPLTFFDFIPNAKAFLKSYYAIHELLGSFWYAIRY